MRRILSMALLLSLLAGCGARTPAADEPPPTMAAEAGAGDLAQSVSGGNGGEAADAVTDFGVRLFQNCFDGTGNTLVSPLSVIEALTMTANGAGGLTLTQMETAIGLPLEKLNAALPDYVRALPASDGGRTALANGIWLNSDAGLAVLPEFLQTTTERYGATVRTAPFDQAAADDINAWVKENTAGRVDRIVDELSPGGAMVLVNALAFDGVWEDIYREDQVRQGTFTTADGQTRDVEMMFSEETAYLRDENATGFIKYYADRGYAFAALLPEAGVDMADYAASLTGERVRALLGAAREDVAVEAAIPKFTAQYGVTLNDALAAMGVTDAFDGERADFSRLTEAAAGGVYIDRVLHRTFVSVDEQGTRAGAATAVEIRQASLMGPTERVYLDRPFLYMLVDCARGVPLFIGAVTDIG